MLFCLGGTIVQPGSLRFFSRYFFYSADNGITIPFQSPIWFKAVTIIPARKVIFTPSPDISPRGDLRLQGKYESRFFLKPAL